MGIKVTGRGQHWKKAKSEGGTYAGKSEGRDYVRTREAGFWDQRA
jgi:hypothetical protein